METVDVHAHYLPRWVLEEARHGAGFDGLQAETLDGVDWLAHRQGFRYPVRAPFMDLQARLRAMDEMSVDRSVLSITPTLFMYWARADETVDFARRVNDDMAALAKDSGGRISAVATLPMQDPDAAVVELRRAVGLGMVGAEIGPVVEGTWLDEQGPVQVLTEADRLGVPLILHPYYVGPRVGLEDFYLTNLIGNPLESTISASRLIFSGLLDHLETLRLVLMHGGGYLPYQVGRLDHGHRVRPESKGCRHLPSTYLRRFWFDTVTHAAKPLRFLVDLVGSDRVVYGTDYPYDMAAGALQEQLAGTGVDAATRSAIAGVNASELFQLSASDGLHAEASHE